MIRIKQSKKVSRSEVRRQRRRRKIRATVFGTTERPRLSIYKSNTAMYAQLIDDNIGKTLLTVSQHSKDVKSKLKNNIEGAKKLGMKLAEMAKAKSIDAIVFDRGGYLYHGKVKALADGAREGGLKF